MKSRIMFLGLLLVTISTTIFSVRERNTSDKLQSLNDSLQRTTMRQKEEIEDLRGKLENLKKIAAYNELQIKRLETKKIRNE